MYIKSSLGLFIYEQSIVDLSPLFQIFLALFQAIALPLNVNCAAMMKNPVQDCRSDCYIGRVSDSAYFFAVLRSTLYFLAISV